MKTATYLRLSLLIPIIVWGLCLLLFFLLAGAMPESNGLAAFGDFATLTDFGILFLAFYVFGIIIWIFPYALLALILFFWSFVGRARMMIKAFALSPLAMTILTISVVILMDLGDSGVSGAFSNPGRVDQDFVAFNLLVAAMTLIWGYICVGIGYGIYRLLQRRGIIRDEEITELTSTSNQPA